MKHVERVAAAKASTEPRWRRYVSDSALAIVGVALVTSVIAVAQLYPRIPTISFVYLLVVLALAGTRGLYAASLASLLAVLAFDFFFFPPLDTFVGSYATLLIRGMDHMNARVPLAQRRYASDRARKTRMRKRGGGRV